MTTNSYKLGDGKLTLGTAPFDVSGQVRSCSVNPKEDVKTTDAIPVLDGTEIPEEEEATFKYTLSGKFLQDLAADGILDWSWDHAGEEQEFVFVPDNDVDRALHGICYPVPLAIGGDITKPRTRPESDFEWRIKGKPTFGVYDPMTGDVEEDV